jgi:hypothetical protein
MEGKVDKQGAAPAEMRNHNLHRANNNRSSRVRMEGGVSDAQLISVLSSDD